MKNSSRIKKITAIAFWGTTKPRGEDYGSDMDFTLSPNHNYHQIDITAHNIDSAIISFPNFDSFRTAVIERKKVLRDGLIPAPELKNEMIREVEQAMIKQPLYRQYLKKCLEILRDK
jgi:hypothetical protein